MLTHRKAVRMAREVMLLPWRLEQPQRSKDSSLAKEDRGTRSTFFLMPWQCCTLKLTRPVRQLRGWSLHQGSS